MKVCDKCRNDDATTVTFEGKKYELCNNCKGKIVRFLNEQNKKGFLGKILNG